MGKVAPIINDAPVRNEAALTSEGEREKFDVPFMPGSIHREEFREFWTSTLNCAPWVENVLKNGYYLPFVALPGEYEERNNASVRRNMLLVTKLVEDLRDQGVIEFVDFKPTCVNPLGLVTKTINGSVKHRLVLDASRWVNSHTDPAAVRLSHLEKALEITQQGDYQTIFDLQAAYHQVRIAPEHVQYLGASIEKDGRKLYFVFKHLPFGLNSAVHAITKLWKPLSAYLHKQGHRFSIYIDDGRILTSSSEEAEAARLFVYDVVRKAGWQIAETKSDGEGESHTEKVYLGFCIDTVTMTVSYPAEKWLALVKLLLAASSHRSVQVKVLAQLVGKVVALLPSHGQIVRICTRSSYDLLHSHVRVHGWSGHILWSPSALRELKFLVNEGHSFNGCVIPHHLMDVAVHTDVVVSDASDFKAAVKWLEGTGKNTVASFNFNEQEARSSSGERELLALYKLIQLPNLAEFFKGANILWLTDSTNFVAFVSKGSPVQSIQDKIFNIFSKLTKLGCKITPLHLYREDERIQQVDHMSKVLDTDNWSIDTASFQQFHDIYGFDMDLFADKGNRKVARFVSKFFHEEAVAVDAFSIPWVGMLWVCPPTYLLAKVVKRIRNTPCRGMLIVPNWPASSFFCLFFVKTRVQPPFELVLEFSPYITQNEGATNTPLFGRTAFTFFAFYFNTL